MGHGWAEQEDLRRQRQSTRQRPAKATGGRPSGPSITPRRKRCGRCHRREKLAPGRFPGKAPLNSEVIPLHGSEDVEDLDVLGHVS